jgi:dolichyl-phosphate-mannose--protein O-mannosyl transferase
MHIYTRQVQSNSRSHVIHSEVYSFVTKDENSHFIVKKPLTFENGSGIEHEPVGFERLEHKSLVRLHHAVTNKRLHSHNVRPGWNDDK